MKFPVIMPRPLEQAVMHDLATDPGFVSLISDWSHTFVEIDHEIISTVILLLPLVNMCTKYRLTS